MWQRFDPGEIDEDFARIAELGLEVVRFFLRWEDFQPRPETVDATALARFDAVMDRIAAHGLRAMPTFFTGHMSGVNWLPEWTLDRSTPAGRFRTISGGKESRYGIGDFYATGLLGAQLLQVRAVGERRRDDPAILAWDLGNEFSNLRAPVWPGAAAHWSDALTEALHETSNLPVTAGTHGEDLTQDRNIRPSSLCAPYEFATMHGYSVYSDFARDRLDPDVVPFLSELMRSCAGKRVLFSEFGNPTCPRGTVSPGDRVALPGESPAPTEGTAAPTLFDVTQTAPFACLTEDEMAVYARNVLERLHRDGALGAYWWCWADYDADLAYLPPFDRAPHELTFGIVRDDGTYKPVAGTLQSFAAERRVVQRTPVALVDEAGYFARLPESTGEAFATYLKRTNE